MPASHGWCHLHLRERGSPMKNRKREPFADSAANRCSASKNPNCPILASANHRRHKRDSHTLAAGAIFRGALQSMATSNETASITGDIFVSYVPGKYRPEGQELNALVREPEPSPVPAYDAAARLPRLRRHRWLQLGVAQKCNHGHGDQRRDLAPCHLPFSLRRGRPRHGAHQLIATACCARICRGLRYLATLLPTI